jgi:protein-S-isoprenylcysteine O-methyltransferase Ste14
MSSHGVNKTLSGHGTPPVTTLPPALAASLDWVERGLLFGLYGWMVYRLIEAYQRQGNAASFALLPSITLMIIFTVTRHKTVCLTSRPRDWILAFTASVIPLFFTPAVVSPLLPSGLCVILMVWGWIIDFYSKFTLGRSFGCVAANRGLKLNGPYRYVRHPMYAGYLLTHIAFVAVYPTALNVGLFLACYATQIPRLILEERILAQDPRYQNYMNLVPYRLIPGLF